MTDFYYFINEADSSIEFPFLLCLHLFLSSNIYKIKSEVLFNFLNEDSNDSRLFLDSVVFSISAMTDNTFVIKKAPLKSEA